MKKAANNDSVEKLIQEFYNIFYITIYNLIFFM